MSRVNDSLATNSRRKNSTMKTGFSPMLLFTSFRYIILIVFGVILFGILNYEDLMSSWMLQYSEMDDPDASEFNSSNRASGPTDGPGDRKIILLWNPFFGEPDYGIGGFGSAPFEERTNCSKVCWTTNDKTYLPIAHAVVLHAFNMGPKGQNITLPQRAHPNQIFIFFILESPLRSYPYFFTSRQNIYDYFNLTFTFIDSPDTDIYIPMGGMKRREKPDESLVLSIDRIKKKKFPIAWFVSNCKAPSARMEYVAELQKHIEVHVYGECGTLTCPPGEYDCYANVMSEHLFYLSFENSYCEGYATEKIFRTLQTHMVPIVYGGANYTKLLGHKSFIDVRQYAYPKALAKHLLYLQRNPKEYQKYFMWKRDYSVLLEGDYKSAGFCRLCEILNLDNYPYKSHFDPLRYWNDERWCLVGDDERRAVHLL